MKREEEKIQIKFFETLRFFAKYDDFLALCYETAFHIPNGGLRTKSQAARLKDMGVKAGVPDVFIPPLRLFIEFKKSTSEKPSKEQEKMMGLLRMEEYECSVVSSVREAVAALTCSLACVLRRNVDRPTITKADFEMMVAEERATLDSDCSVLLFHYFHIA